MPESYLDALVRAVVSRLGVAPDDHEDSLRRLLVEAREAFPEVQPEAATMTDALLRALSGPDDLATAISELDGPELWLAAACLDGSAAALREFDARYLERLGGALQPFNLAPADQDDVRQTVREKLFVQDDRLFDYAGRGSVGALVKIVAVRTAIDRKRQRQRRPQHEPSLDERVVDVLVDTGLSPELGAARQQQLATLKAAFQKAVRSLSERDRGILRLSVLKRSSIDAIAALHDVHRSTAARWLVDIRERIGEVTRRELRFGQGLSDSELHSVFRAVDSQLELSLSRLLSDGNATRDD